MPTHGHDRNTASHTDRALDESRSSTASAEGDATRAIDEQGAGEWSREKVAGEATSVASGTKAPRGRDASDPHWAEPDGSRDPHPTNPAGQRRDV